MTEYADGRGRAGRDRGTRSYAVPRGLIVLLGIAAAVIVGGGIQATAWLIGPMFLALTIVIVVAPVRDRLRRRGVPGWVGSLAIIVLSYATLLVMIAVVIVSVGQLATELPKYASQADALVQQATAFLARFGIGPQQIQQAASSLDWQRLAQFAGSLVGEIAGLATNIVFLLALLLFLGVEAGGVRARLAAISSDRPQVADALAGFARGTRKYMGVTTIFGLIVAALDTIALALLGVPLAITWGLLSFITNYIPNIGFILGLIPPAALALLAGGWELAATVIVVYCVLNFVVQSLIQPRFVGDSVGLSVTVTFVSLIFWTWLIGPLGAILAIPLTLLAKALLVDIDPGAAWADALLRDRPAPVARPPGPEERGPDEAEAAPAKAAPDEMGAEEVGADEGRDAVRPAAVPESTPPGPAQA